MSEAGSVVWPSPSEPLWTFDWRLAGYPDEEGIVIRSARYRDHQVFYKASLPSLRVQYNGSCGPFKDPLDYTNAQPTSRCPNSRVCIYSYVSGGVRGLGVESYHRISAYRLTHRWVFWENGWIMARLYSAGLYCDDDHRHHAYWRFDFDIDDAGNDQVFEDNTYTPDVGWGPGWHTKTREISRLKNPSSNRRWAVMDLGSQRGYIILPGPNDGTADAFSTSDLWVLRYHGNEDLNGQQGSAANDGLSAYLNLEDVSGQNVVVWYAGHLAHEASDGGAHWHGAGPNLAPFGSW